MADLAKFRLLREVTQSCPFCGAHHTWSPGRHLFVRTRDLLAYSACEGCGAKGHYLCDGHREVAGWSRPIPKAADE